MPRPNFITNNDIARWQASINDDQTMPPEMLTSPIIMEVCYAGLWLVEQLQQINCPESIIVRIQWTAGRLSYGHDTWEVHQEILKQYKDNTLTFESDDSVQLN